MKILLIVPPMCRFGGINYQTFHLGLGYIASVLRQQNHELQIYDTNISREFDHAGTVSSDPDALFENYNAAVEKPDHPAWIEAENVIRTFAPSLVGITCRVPDIQASHVIAGIVKKIDAHCKVAVGGPAATTCTALMMQNKNIDFAVRGEGEKTMSELVVLLSSDSPPDIAEIDGLTWKKGPEIVHNRNRQLMENIDVLPLPARDLLVFADQIPAKSLHRIMGDMVTSRGCPSNCTYCANNTVWGGRRIRFRSPRSIVDEMVHVRDTYGVRHIILWDDHLITKRERILELCDLLVAENVGVNWVGFARADSLDDELIKSMQRAGCEEIQIGIESGSDRILRMVKKGVTLAEFRHAAKLLRKNGMRWFAFLMIGFPGETREEMKATMRLLYELRPDAAMLSTVTPYPGTELFQEAQRRGMRQTEWLSCDTFKSESILVDTIPQEEFQELAIKYMKECEIYNSRRRRGGGYRKKIPLPVRRFLRAAERRIVHILRRSSCTAPDASKYGHFGDYTSWEAAVGDSHGSFDSDHVLEKVRLATLAIQEGRAAYTRDSVVFQQIEYSWPLLACLLWIASRNESRLNLADFGGALGTSYFQNRGFLSHLRELRWNVVEQQNYAECGKKYFEREPLKFFSDLEQCFQEQCPDAILLSSVLMYVVSPYALLEKIIKLAPKYILFDRTAFMTTARDRLTVQHVHPNLFDASYPCWFLNLDNFKKCFAGHYILVTEFDGFEKTNIDDSVFKGFMFERKSAGQ